jgi:hypothetical protein
MTNQNSNASPATPGPDPDWRDMKKYLLWLGSTMSNYVGRSQTPDEIIHAAYIAIPEPVRNKMPKEWEEKDAVWFWCTAQIDGEFVTEMWKSNEGALWVLRYLEHIQGKDNG